jgi:hypothetical protein
MNTVAVTYHARGRLWVHGETGLICIFMRLEAENLALARWFGHLGAASTISI